MRNKPDEKPTAPPPADQPAEPAIPPAQDTALAKIKPANQRGFLQAYSVMASIVKAAKAAKIDRWSHYAWMKQPDYAAAFAEAGEVAAQTLESEAVRRAHEGVMRPVLYQGKQVSVKGKPLFQHDYSDVLLIFLLKGMKPDKYRDNAKVEFSGSLEIAERLNAARKRTEKPAAE